MRNHPAQMCLAQQILVWGAVLASGTLGWASQAQEPVHLPDRSEMQALHAGKPMSEVGLTKDELDQLLKTIWDDNRVEALVPDDYALEQELLATRVDMGEGIEKGLVLQDKGKMCANGNCRTWFFRKQGEGWAPVVGWNGLGNEGIDVSLYAFVHPQRGGMLFDLVVINHSSGDNYPYRVWEFSTGGYAPVESDCWHELEHRREEKGCVDFQLPERSRWLHGGDGITEAGLSAGEISQITSAILKGGLDDEDMRSADALRRELKVRFVEMGEGSNKGLVVSGGAKLCGATGNCNIWLFRKSGSEWKVIRGDWGSTQDTEASTFVFEPPNRNGLYDLVTATHLSCCEVPVAWMWFDGTEYRTHADYCWYPQEGEVLEGECE